MNLLLIRDTFSQNSTIGELSIDGTFFCYVLEDVARPVKIHGQTCIPAGKYLVTITPSARFKRDMPLLNDVPAFSGIRIHQGNNASNTDGCLLVGRTKAKDFVGESRAAFAELFPLLQAAIDRGETIEIEIRGGFETVEAE